MTAVIVPCSIPVSLKFMLFCFKTSQTCLGFKLVARSMSSTISPLIIFLIHPPTYLISESDEKLFIELKIFLTGVFLDRSIIFLKHD